MACSAERGVDRQVDDGRKRQLARISSHAVRDLDEVLMNRDLHGERSRRAAVGVAHHSPPEDVGASHVAVLLDDPAPSFGLFVQNVGAYTGAKTWQYFHVSRK